MEEQIESLAEEALDHLLADVPEEQLAAVIARLSELAAEWKAEN